MREKKVIGEQLAVINDLMTGTEEESKILETHSVSQRQYRKWLGQEAFVEELQRGMDAVRRRALLKIARHVPVAVDGLVEMIKGDPSESKRKACLDLLALQVPQDKPGAGRRVAGITKEQAGRILEVLAEKEHR